MLKNSRSAYGWLAIVLHWISAVGVIWLYILGEKIEHAKEDQLGRDVVVAAMDFHISIGMCFFVFLAARVVSSVVQQKPQAFEQHRYLMWVQKTVTWLWLLLITVQIITGPLARWSGGRSLAVFDWFEIPSPMGRVEWLHEAMEFVHSTTPNLFWPLIILHVAGAAKHLIIDRDGTVQRMLWVKQR